jgi:hypothetical protein
LYHVYSDKYNNIIYNILHPKVVPLVCDAAG